jgi:preprotein translocase subunit SecF
MEFFSHQTKFDFCGKFGLFGGLSLTAVFVSIVTLIIWQLNYGIDFAGGYEIQARFPRDVQESEIRKLLSPIGLMDMRLQRYGEASHHEYLILFREHGSLSQEAKAALKADFEKLAGSANDLTTWSVAESGESVSAAFGQPITEEQVREVLQRHGLVVKEVNKSERTDKPEYAIQLESLSGRIEATLRKAFEVPSGTQMISRVEFVGPQVGAQLRNQGLMALFYAMVFMLIYVAIRFDFYFAPGAIIALLHDTIVTIGVFALFRLEFNLTVVAAVLALVGFSMNDTIVVYDRIRENAAKMRGSSMRAIVNAAVNQTLSRTVLTSGTAFLSAISLLVFGGATIREFALATTIGIIVGTYSSIFIASPVFIMLHEYYDRRKGRAPGTATA